MSAKGMTWEKIPAALTLLLLSAAWAGGGMRANSTMAARLGHISPEIGSIRQIGPDLYQAQRHGAGAASGPKPRDTLYIALESHPGYGGPLSVAAVVNGEGTIEHVAILKSADTRTFVANVVDKGLLNAFLGTDLEHPPRVDAVSGATLSSTAILKGVERAGAAIGAARFGLPAAPAPETAISPEEYVKLAVVAFFFLAALAITAKRFPFGRKKTVWGLRIASVILLGFVFGAQFSLATVAMLLGGAWTQGLATYAPMLCLILAVLVWVVGKKNLFCSMICPFGGLQECIGAIGAGATPTVNAWMKWPARLLALAALCFALYYRNPPAAIYEPFGRTFNFIGSGILFAVSVLIILSSLGFKRPWCRLLCPVTPFFDYLYFMRSWASGVFQRKAGKPATPPAVTCSRPESAVASSWKSWAGAGLFLLVFGLCGMELANSWRARPAEDDSSVSVVRSLPMTDKQNGSR